MSRIKLKTVKKKNNSNKKISDCYIEYLDYCKAIGQRPATIESKKRFYIYELPKLIDVNETIDKITYKSVENHVNKMIELGYKGNYYQTFVIKLKAFLSYCFKRDYLEEFEVKIPNILIEKKEVYTESEINLLLKKPVLKNCLISEYRNWLIVNFFLGTGCRSTTLINVKVQDINFDNDSILFRHMKTKRQIIVPLSLTLKGVLKEYIYNLNLKKEDLLFTTVYGKNLNYDTLHQAICSFCNLRKVKMRGCNTFRNTFATMFIKNGGDIYRLKVILGHSNIKTTERYVNLLPLDLNEDMLKYNPLDVLSSKNKKLSFCKR